MARMPATNAASMPDQQRPEADLHAGLARDELAHLEDDGAQRDRRGHQEREPGGCLTVETGEAGGRDADARPADARHQRQRLGCADPAGDRERDVVHALGPAAPSVRQPQDHGADDQRHRDQADLAERGLGEVAQEEAGDGRRDRGRDQQPGQPPVGIALERPVADGGEAGRHQADPVGAEVDEQRQQRPQVEHHAERQRRDERIGPAEQVRDDDQVPGRRDRQELGEPLHDPHDRALGSIEASRHAQSCRARSLTHLRVRSLTCSRRRGWPSRRLGTSG